ncbi:Craniofacial development protein 2 [Stylophora pistillata]|uniref:Craniofacial development protein 2 n=1 Tax=Stylophora pistillata TaxID=50429 RepID=A0A2B4SAI2_STYPI|nr:Craniofacial development protein 2 [Stylophora pistillata]
MERNDKDTSKPVIRHFNLPNHSKQHMVICGLSLHLATNGADDDAKADFYERLQGVIDGVANKDLIPLLGDLNAKVGSGNTSFETVMGKHGVGKMNENGELFADFCSFNKLVMGGSVFPHKEKGTDVASDHHLLVGKCRLKLKNHHTSSQRTSHKFNIEMLKEEETKNRFKLTLRNTFQGLASLHENEQHSGVEESQTVVNKVWQSMKDIWRKTCEETQGSKTKLYKAYVSTATLEKIEARKKEKDVLNRSKARAQKAEALIRYSKVNREVKQNIRKDLTPGKGDLKELYSITKTLAGVRKTTDRPVRAERGEVVTYQEEQRRKLLNRPPPSEIPNIEPAHTPLHVNENRPGKVEIKRAIKRLKNGQAAGPDGLPPQAIKEDLRVPVYKYGK